MSKEALPPRDPHHCHHKILQGIFHRRDEYHFRARTGINVELVLTQMTYDDRKNKKTFRISYIQNFTLAQGGLPLRNP